MAAPDVTKVQGATGTITWDGVAAGIVANVHLVPIQRSFLLTAEERGGLIVEEYEMGRDWLMSCMIRGVDSTMLAAIFPNVSGSAVTEGIAQSKGAPLSSRAGALIFTPRDSTHHGFTLYRALPRVAESSRIPFSVHNRINYAAIFRAIPDASGRVLVFTS